MKIEIGNIYVYKEFINGKLLNCFPIKAISESEEIYRFQALNEKCEMHYNIHKDVFPIHEWNSDKNIERKTEIVGFK